MRINKKKRKYAHKKNIEASRTLFNQEAFTCISHVLYKTLNKKKGKLQSVNHLIWF